MAIGISVTIYSALDLLDRITAFSQTPKILRDNPGGAAD